MTPDRQKWKIISAETQNSHQDDKVCIGMAETYIPVKLSIIGAAREFGMSRTTLKTKLKDQSPDEKGCYSIKQIAGAIYSDSRALKDATERERAEWFSLRNRKFRGELLNKADLVAGLEIIFISIKNIVMGSVLPEKDKKDLLDELSRCPAVLKAVADKQAKVMGDQRMEEPENE